MVRFCTPEAHDQMIAYTSQLAHVVSGAYIKNPLAQSHRGFSAGSFLDTDPSADERGSSGPAAFGEWRPVLPAMDGLIMHASTSTAKPWPPPTPKG